MTELKNVKKIRTDILIVGSGAAGLYCALKLPKEKQIVIITKEDAESSDSFLAQGGMCVLKSEDDYDSYFEDTMRVGHYKNRKESVDIMIRSSQNIVKELIGYGWNLSRRMENFYIQERGDIRRTALSFMKTSQEKKSQVNCWRR